MTPEVRAAAERLRRVQSGERGNRLSQLGRPFHVLTKSGTRRLWAVFQCECGVVCAASMSNVRGGATTSCGCYDRERRRKHGYADTRVYRVWRSMLSRCYGKHPGFSNYGGRGIVVCERWRTFENFLADMGEPPDGLSLDRINNDGNYEPGNCRWATQEEQHNNRRTTKRLTIDGETLSLMEWCKRPGSVSHTCAEGRLRRGWPAKLAVFAPHQRSNGRRPCQLLAGLGIEVKEGGAT